MSKTNKKNKSIPQAKRPEEPKEINIFPKKSAAEIEKLRDEKLLFSFHFLDTTTQQFNCGRTCDGWFLHLLENVREISRLNRNEFVQIQRNHYDVHALNWPYEEFSKFPIDNQVLEGIDPNDQLQFRLSSSGGRVHGFLRHNTFYVVWLDPHHNLDPDQRFGGVKYYDAPLTPFQELEMEKEELNQRYVELKREYETLWSEWLSSQESDQSKQDAG